MFPKAATPQEEIKQREYMKMKIKDAWNSIDLTKQGVLKNTCFYSEK